MIKIKKSKKHKVACHRNKHKIWKLQNCFEAILLENKINYLEKLKLT